MGIKDDDNSTVIELNLTPTVLKAAGIHLDKACEFENKKLILCQPDQNDPEKCIAEANAFISCAISFFQSVRKSCGNEFSEYVDCLDKCRTNEDITKCRESKAIFDKCMLDNFELERREYELRVNYTMKPKPPVEGPVFDLDAKPNLPKNDEKQRAKHRMHYLWI